MSGLRRLHLSLLPEPATRSCTPCQISLSSPKCPHTLTIISQWAISLWSGREIIALLTSNIPITLMNCRADDSVDKSSTSLYLLLSSTLRLAIRSLCLFCNQHQG